MKYFTSSYFTSHSNLFHILFQYSYGRRARVKSDVSSQRQLYAERVFAPEALLGHARDSSLSDMIQTTLMLIYNDRATGHAEHRRMHLLAARDCGSESGVCRHQSVRFSCEIA